MGLAFKGFGIPFANPKTPRRQFTPGQEDEHLILYLLVGRNIIVVLIILFMWTNQKASGRQ
jgi:hypothetical protein